MSEMSHEDAELIRWAVQIAAATHSHQYRKHTGEPYIVHPLRVMLALALKGCSPAVQAAGVLHDVIEDCGWSVARVDGCFGPEVARLVEALTRQKGEPYADFIGRVIEAGPDAMTIKRADIADNLSSPGSSPPLTRRYLKALARL